MGERYKKANALQIAAIIPLLKEHFREGTYAPDWSDARIAKEVGCQESHVSNLRLQHFGQLRKPPRKISPDLRNLEARVARLETFAEMLCSQLGIANFSWEELP